MQIALSEQLVTLIKALICWLGSMDSSFWRLVGKNVENVRRLLTRYHWRIFDLELNWTPSPLNGSTRTFGVGS